MYVGISKTLLLSFTKFIHIMWNLKFNLIFVLLWVACFLSTVKAKTNRISCKDENGDDVDWYYIYKLPKHFDTNINKKDDTGLSYFFVTSKNYDSWQFSSYKISEPQSMTAQTLQPIFDDQTALLVAYNDEFPNGTVNMSGGHTKGVVATNGETGIWLIHSVPKFPSIPHYEYPTNGAHYAQSFLCLTLDDEQMHKIGTQLIYNEPNIYFTRVPFMLSNKYPELEEAIEKNWHRTPPYYNLLDIVTLDGKKFKSFAKGHKFQQDLYEDLLAPTLDVNLLVETWRNGAGNMASNCTKDDKVYNIAQINVKPFQISFKTTNDHSKWAVSEATGLKLWRWRIGGSDWICVGDINRQQHQLQRGGGTVCQKSSRVAGLYRNLVGNFEPCEKFKKSLS